MPRKKSEHYVNNKELLQAITVYRSKVLIARVSILRSMIKIHPSQDHGRVNPLFQTTLVLVS